MPTSGVTSWNPAATFIMTGAYRRLGVVNEAETPTAGMYEEALFTLNGLVKEWQASGLHIWTEDEGIIFLQPGQSRYLLGGTNTDNATDAHDYALTELTTDEAAGSTSFAVESTTGFVALDKVGIVQDDGETFWTTVSTVPTSTTFTTSTGLDSAASIGNAVVAYTTKIIRPLRIPFARTFNLYSEQEMPIMAISRKEYWNMPNKTSQGMPCQYFYDPQLDRGEFYVWPTPSNSDTAIRMTWYRTIQDFTDPDDTSDLPQEWLSTLVWNLAADLAPAFDIPPPRYAMIKATADNKLEMARGWDREPEPIQFMYGEDE